MHSWLESQHFYRTKASFGPDTLYCNGIFITIPSGLCETAGLQGLLYHKSNFAVKLLTLISHGLLVDERSDPEGGSPLRT